MTRIFLFVVSVHLATVFMIAQPGDPTRTPLDVLATGTYRGQIGGLYPDGQNVPPIAHQRALEAETRRIVPVDALGRIDSSGKIGFICLGASNLKQEFPAVVSQLQRHPSIRPHLVFVNGAQGGMSLEKMIDTVDPRYWENEVDRAIERAGLTHQQVRVVWLKTSLLQGRGDTLTFEHAVSTGVERYVQLMHIIAAKLPNVAIVYGFGRNSTAYVDTTDGNRLSHLEPRAYYEGWIWKRLVELQIQGDERFVWTQPQRRMPLLTWGAYMWTAPPSANTFGHVWLAEDVVDDGLHPSAQGEAKIGRLISNWFTQDTWARQWVLAQNPVASVDEAVVELTTTPRMFDMLGREVTSATVSGAYFKVWLEGGRHRVERIVVP